MKIFYYEAAHGNFGDDLNKWIWDRLIPEKESFGAGVYMSGIGTILADWMPKHERWVICSSGTGYGWPAIDMNSPNTRVAWVRGPLTAQALGLPPEAAVTDGAILLASLPEYTPLPAGERSGAIFIPHKSAFLAGNWEGVCKAANVRLISPQEDTDFVLQAIRRSSLVLADSMHAAIVADTFRVPWIPVKTSPEINEFKWLDWAMSMEVPYEPVELPPSSYAEMYRSRQIAAHIGSPPETERVAFAIGQFEKLREPGYEEQKARRESWLGELPVRILRKGLRASPLEKPVTNRAAAMLRTLSQRPGYLSSDEVFEARYAEAMRRVATVPALAASLSG